MASCAASFYTLPRFKVAPSPVLRLGRRRRVIIAEDNNAFRKILKEAFDTAGYRVTECADGLELLSLLKNTDASDLAAVVSDHRMPGRQGLDVLSALGAASLGAPFILMTAFGDEEIHQRAKELGAARVVNKPLDEDFLVETVRSLTNDS